MFTWQQVPVPALVVIVVWGLLPACYAESTPSAGEGGMDAGGSGGTGAVSGTGGVGDAGGTGGTGAIGDAGGIGGMDAGGSGGMDAGGSGGTSAINDGGGICGMDAGGTSGTGAIGDAGGVRDGSVCCDDDAGTCDCTDDGWSVPFALDPVGQALSPDVVIDANGNVTVTWARTLTNPTAKVWTRRYVPGTGWNEASPIEPLQGYTGTAYARTVIDHDGNVTAVWSQFVSDHYEIATNRYVADVGWGEVTSIGVNDSGGLSSLETSVVDDDGTVTVLWRRGTSSLWSNRFTPGVGWGSAEQVVMEAPILGSPQLATDGTHLTAVWLSGDDSVRSSRYIREMGWGPAAPVGTAIGVQWGTVQVVAGKDGSATVLWHQPDSTIGLDASDPHLPKSLWINRFTHDTGWGTAIQLAGSSDPPSSGGLIDDGDGNVMVAWNERRGSRSNLWFRRFTACAGWSTAALLDMSRTGLLGAPAFALVGQGKVIALWVETGDPDRMWWSKYTPNVGWGTPAIIELNGAPLSFRVTIAANHDTLAVVWSQYDRFDIPEQLWARLLRH